jgi:hypothetical protein
MLFNQCRKIFCDTTEHSEMILWLHNFHIE